MMLPSTPKIDNTDQDENGEMEAVGLYSWEKCSVSVTPFVVLFPMTLTFIQVYVAFRNLTTE